jgi:hypothetical protein
MMSSASLLLVLSTSAAKQLKSITGTSTSGFIANAVDLIHYTLYTHSYQSGEGCRGLIMQVQMAKATMVSLGYVSKIEERPTKLNYACMNDS